MYVKYFDTTSCIKRKNDLIVFQICSWDYKSRSGFAEATFFFAFFLKSIDQVDIELLKKEKIVIVEKEVTKENLDDKNIFYTLFLKRLSDLTKNEPLTKENLSSKLKLHPTQVGKWLKEGVESGDIIKLVRPVRYEINK